MEKLDEKFIVSNWDKNPDTKSVIIQSENKENSSLASEFENYLMDNGLVGITGSYTSEQYHQNLVGIEGWYIDFVASTYTRIDSYKITKLRKEGICSISFNELKDHFINHPGAIAALKYSI